MKKIFCILGILCANLFAATTAERLADGIPVAPSGTGITPAKGSLWVANGSAFAPLAPSTNAYVLTLDSSQTLGMKWAAASGGGANTQYAKKTANYAVTATDNLSCIDCDSSGGAFTITLGASATVGAGITVIVRKVDSSSNAVTITANAADGINGGSTGSSISLGYQFECKRLIATGAVSRRPLRRHQM
jgi:hypothetical protein